MYYLISIQKGCLELIAKNESKENLVSEPDLQLSAEGGIYENPSEVYFGFDRVDIPQSSPSRKEGMTMVVSSKRLQEATQFNKEDLEFLIDSQCISPRILRDAAEQIW